MHFDLLIGHSQENEFTEFSKLVQAFFDYKFSNKIDGEFPSDRFILKIL
jgi:hypothetical protein